MLGFYIGWVVGCLTILAIVSVPRKVPKPFVVGKDVTVPREACIPTAHRKRTRIEVVK